MMPSAQALSRSLDTARFYWRTCVRPQRRATAVILGLMLVSSALETMTIGLTVPLLEIITHPEASQGVVARTAAGAIRALGFVATANAIIFACLVFVSVCFLVRSIVLLLIQLVTASAAVRLRRSMKQALFARFIRGEYEHVAARGRGPVVHHINVPSDSIAGSITMLGNLFSGVLTGAVIIGLLVYLSWWVTVVIGVLSVGGIQVWRWHSDRRSAAHGRELYDLRAEMNKLLVDAFDGLKVVKSQGVESWLGQRLDAPSDREFTPELRLVLFRNGPLLVNEIIASVIVLSLGAVTFLAPSLGIRFSMLVAFLLAMRRIAPAVASINTSLVNLNVYRRNLEVIDDVLHELPQEPVGGLPVARVDEVRLDGVRFAYAARPEHAVLRDVTLAMHRGTVTAVVGPTGSGKSTIANLLVALYRVQAGAIRVDGRELSTLDLAQWRKKIGYVCQDIFVFNATIRENIAIGDDTVSSDAVERAARLAQLHDFIVSLPDGYDTIVGDRGMRLSGGQCQRLAIARAVLRQPQVLIFDEATSALDNVTERAVYDAISALRRDAIVVVIAHRLSTIREADQIVVLRGGHVVEQGRHDELLGRRGVYAQLYCQDDEADETATASEPAGMPVAGGD